MKEEGLLCGVVIVPALLGGTAGHLMTLHMDPRRDSMPQCSVWMTDEGLQQLAGELLDYMQPRGLVPLDKPPGPH